MHSGRERYIIRQTGRANRRTGEEKGNPGMISSSRMSSLCRQTILVDGDHHGDGNVTPVVNTTNKIFVRPIRDFTDTHRYDV